MIALGFLVVGALTNRLLRLNFREFYAQNRFGLLMATATLFLPLVGKGFFNLKIATDRANFLSDDNVKIWMVVLW